MRNFGGDKCQLYPGLKMSCRVELHEKAEAIDSRSEELQRSGVVSLKWAGGE